MGGCLSADSNSRERRTASSRRTSRNDRNDDRSRRTSRSSNAARGRRSSSKDEALHTPEGGARHSPLSPLSPTADDAELPGLVSVLPTPQQRVRIESGEGPTLTTSGDISTNLTSIGNSNSATAQDSTGNRTSGVRQGLQQLEHRRASRGSAIFSADSLLAMPTVRRTRSDRHLADGRDAPQSSDLSSVLDGDEVRLSVFSRLNSGSALDPNRDVRALSPHLASLPGSISTTSDGSGSRPLDGITYQPPLAVCVAPTAAASTNVTTAEADARQGGGCASRRSSRSQTSAPRNARMSFWQSHDDLGSVTNSSSQVRAKCESASDSATDDDHLGDFAEGLAHITAATRNPSSEQAPSGSHQTFSTRPCNDFDASDAKRGRLSPSRATTGDAPESVEVSRDSSAAKASISGSPSVMDLFFHQPQQLSSSHGARGRRSRQGSGIVQLTSAASNHTAFHTDGPDRRLSVDHLEVSTATAERSETSDGVWSFNNEGSIMRRAAQSGSDTPSGAVSSTSATMTTSDYSDMSLASNAAVGSGSASSSRRHQVSGSLHRDGTLFADSTSSRRPALSTPSSSSGGGGVRRSVKDGRSAASATNPLLPLSLGENSSRRDDAGGTDRSERDGMQSTFWAPLSPALPKLGRSPGFEDRREILKQSKPPAPSTLRMTTAVRVEVPPSQPQAQQHQHPYRRRLSEPRELSIDSNAPPPEQRAPPPPLRPLTYHRRPSEVLSGRLAVSRGESPESCDSRAAHIGEDDDSGSRQNAGVDSEQSASEAPPEAASGGAFVSFFSTSHSAVNT